MEETISSSYFFVLTVIEWIGIAFISRKTIKESVVKVKKENK